MDRPSASHAWYVNVPYMVIPLVIVVSRPANLSVQNIVAHVTGALPAVTSSFIYLLVHGNIFTSYCLLQPLPLGLELWYVCTAAPNCNVFSHYLCSWRK